MKKILRELLAILAIVLACGVVCSIVVFKTKDYYSKQIKIETVVKQVPVSVPKIIEKEVQISGETIRSSMANIGELCTAEYRYTHVERVDDSRTIKDFEIPLTKATFIYSYDGNIMAGIDFTKIQIDKNDSEKIIAITLPEVEIIASDVDQNSFKLYDEKNSIFNPISVADVADSFADLKNSEEKKAIEEGLFDKARANAKMLVENFMRGSYDVEGYNIDVLFEAHE